MVSFARNVGMWSHFGDTVFRMVPIERIVKDLDRKARQQTVEKVQNSHQISTFLGVYEMSEIGPVRT